MKIEIKFVRSQAAPSPRKKALGRVVALLALLALVLAIPASAKYVGQGDAVFSTELDSAVYTGTEPITVTGTAIGITPGMYVPNYAGKSAITFSVLTGSAGYTVPGPGWVTARAGAYQYGGVGSNAPQIGVYVNDLLVADMRLNPTEEYIGYSATVPVAKGDVVRIASNATVYANPTPPPNNKPPNNLEGCYFIPPKWQAIV